MVENLGGERPEIEWPREIEPEQLQTMLGENRQGAKLRNVVSRKLVSESDDLSLEFGPRLSIDGFTIVASQLRDTGDFVDSDRDAEVEEITNRLFAQRSDFGTTDRLGLLAEAVNQYQQHVPGGIEMEASELFRRLAETMQYAEILKRDPSGFELVDYLGKQNSYQPDVDPGNFEQENLGRKEATERYKKIYSLLVDKGATPD